MEDTDWERKLIPKEGHAVLRYNYYTGAEEEDRLLFPEQHIEKPKPRREN